jgi:aminopeptidase N
MSQPAYAKYWWPCKDRPDDKAQVSAWLTVPEPLLAVSNGRLLAETDAGSGWRSYLWREDYPLATYLVSVAVSDYTLLSEDCATSLGNQIPLHNWIFPPDVAAAAADLEPLCAMIDFYEGVAGPYPFQGEKYGHAEFLWPYGAMEHQTVTSLDQNYLDGEQGGRYVILHELSHQWFGDALTPRTWADIWLNEGFATYSEALWAGSSYEEGEAGYFAYMQDRLTNAFHWNGFGPVYDPAPVLQPVVYTKGAWILHMLRGRLGDADFFALLRDWAGDDERRYGTVTTAEFVALASSYAGEDLEPFFDPWLTTEAIPRVWLDHTVSDGPRGPDSRLELQLQQVQSVLFDNVYPVWVATSAGDTTVSVPLAAPRTQQVFDLAGSVGSVVLDPQRWVYWVEAGAPLPEQTGIERVYPNPCRSYVVVRYGLDTPQSVRLRIVDARGRSVYDRDLGVVAPAGEANEFGWDLQGRGGGTVGGGVYWAVLDVGDRRTVAKFTVVH